ncbi:hypothetical protein WICMUC_004523 [Wickerhamomyces mucosus]|uniref:Golgi SNAP receptor complex member 1 n=1 Tax=Wickerhamomyces mucosus TaxID=1378264 RepID=A0A9P8TAL0_9ASCO|nr:hypothetical protein WICMUC_004523 [Wickerhamomyces mucosus]
MSSFTTLRSSLISLDTQINQSLTTYSKFAISITSQPTSDELKSITSIETNLNKYDQILNQLTRLSDSQNISTINLSQLSRHKESYHAYWKNFMDIKNSILQERNKINLLFNVREDLNDYKQKQKIGNDEASQLDYIQNETSRVNTLNSITDDLISSVLETRDTLLNQRNTLNLNSNTIINNLKNVPGLNTLIGKINTRKRRDSLILASLILVCILILYFTL